MTLSDEETRLAVEVEHLLENWALPEKGDDEWSSMAKAIDARIADVTPGKGEGDEWLFLPPLPLMNGERVLDTHVLSTLNVDVAAPPDSHTSGVQHRLVASRSGAEQPRRKLPSAREVADELGPSGADRTSGVHPSDARSLKEIAEEALRDTQTARATETLRATHSVTALPAAHRRPADSGIQLSRAVATATTPGESLHPAGAHPSTTTARLVDPSESSSTRRKADDRKSKILRPLFWVTGVVAAAAALLIWVGREQAGPEVASAEAPVVRGSEDRPSAEAATSNDEKPESDRPNAIAAANPLDEASASNAEEESAMRADDLPMADSTLKTAQRHVATRPASKPRAESEPASNDGVAETTPKDPVLIPAADLSSRPAHPSVGAAQAAVGATLSSARLCVVSRLAPSQATVLFGSDGHVRSVQVSGDAAGTPAEGCIQRAMGAARVRPFTDESFSVRTTVRP